MKLNIQRNFLEICAENIQDEVYLEQVVGFNIGEPDNPKEIRVEPFSSADGVKTISLHKIV